MTSALSLFAGAGGMDVGFERAGFKVVFANEIDRDACQTYRLNLGGELHQGDLRDFIPTLSRLRGVDLLFGGPPCQGFSVAGRMDPSDERSQLLFSFFHVLDVVAPRAFVCENVKALAELSRWEDVRREMRRRVSDDYEVSLHVLNAADFGVPQARERMFFVGVRKDVSRPSSGLATTIGDRLKEAQRPAPVIGDIVRALGPAGSQGNARTCNARIFFARNPVLRQSPYAGMLFNGAGRPTRANGVCLTLPASMGGNKTPIIDEAEIFGGAGSFVEQYHRDLLAGGCPRSGEAPGFLRRLTIDEAIAVQTFPRTHAFAGSQSSIYKQIGNAVPCDLAEAVATAVRDVAFAGDSIQAAA
ncbi:MAG: DNA cytosine methyltransferase [Caulobacterales bacterium]|nr:DNA cytosine methyltransferase [Caulobacterales bacterium]